MSPKDIFSCHSIHFGRFKSYESSGMLKKSEMYNISLSFLTMKVPKIRGFPTTASLAGSLSWAVALLNGYGVYKHTHMVL